MPLVEGGDRGVAGGLGCPGVWGEPAGADGRGGGGVDEQESGVVVVAAGAVDESEEAVGGGVQAGGIGECGL